MNFRQAAILILAALIVLATVIAHITGVYYGYSEGSRTGDIYKFSEKGLFYKSWEGEMYLGGVHQSGGDIPTLEMDKFYFSIPDSETEYKKDIIDKINTCVETRKPCKIRYKQWWIGPIGISSEYVVQGVEMTGK